MSNTNKASGGYMTAWSEAEQFKPKDGETVLFHMKSWKPDEYSIGSYLPEDGIVLLGEEPVPYSIVDYWMRIPPIPNENAIPYIIGDDYPEEEKPFTDLATERRQWLEKQRWGVTSEEVAEDVRKTIEIRMKMHKTEIE